MEQKEDVEQQLLHTLAEARKLGPANPLLLSTMYSLASFYREHHAFEKAERLYQEALLIKEQLHGPHHPDLAIILHQYAALLRDAQRVQEATELEQRARQIQNSSPIPSSYRQ
ncbi:tetratricopeptide repeat protein [Candidatus Nitronereus thalassa]|uniref:Tetratricopeptide repeat protein n=1 Tax=Candidatus Nitronereus thalassa TaxID=3020898 RepID=A0ABU3KBG5_9BACT|nr:tetratricopeptide repeat protein [Candidatus Nitronereus thalassa]MDT7043781.1 tetratricopeptide repeat protein [Candidatus Nitronereus thalassa]